MHCVTSLQAETGLIAFPFQRCRPREIPAKYVHGDCFQSRGGRSNGPKERGEEMKQMSGHSLCETWRKYLPGAGGETEIKERECLWKVKP